MVLSERIDYIVNEIIYIPKLSDQELCSLKQISQIKYGKYIYDLATDSNNRAFLCQIDKNKNDICFSANITLRKLISIYFGNVVNIITDDDSILDLPIYDVPLCQIYIKDYECSRYKCVII